MSDEKILKPSDGIAEAAQLADDINGETGAVKAPVTPKKAKDSDKANTGSVSNWQIIKNFGLYTPAERKH